MLLICHCDIPLFQIESTKETVTGTVVAVKDYGMTKVARTLDSPVGRYAMEKVNEALTVSEDYVEKYLPPSEEELDEKAKGTYSDNLISICFSGNIYICIL